MSEPTQPPEAHLLELLRTELRPKLSVRAAAEKAGMSDARWRQIAKGFKYEAGGIRVPARAPADTLARMAKVVGATPDQLRKVGRDDAADALAQLHGPPHSGDAEAFTDQPLTRAIEHAMAAIRALSDRAWELQNLPAISASAQEKQAARGAKPDTDPSPSPTQ